MTFKDFDYIYSDKFKGKIILTSFPGLNGKGIFEESLFFSQLDIFEKNNCSSITSFVEDIEFQKLYNKKFFVEKTYKNNLKWYHLPISDLSAPNLDFKYKWETTKGLLKNELINGHNITAIQKALIKVVKNKPNVIIANTVKGKGVSFMENNNLWHYKNPNLDELNKSLIEIKKKYA